MLFNRIIVIAGFLVSGNVANKYFKNKKGSSLEVHLHHHGGDTEARTGGNEPNSSS